MTLRSPLPWILALMMLLGASAHGQTLNDIASSTRVQEKVRRMELLNLLLPVLLTKEQITTLLPSIVKARKADEDLKKKEAAILRGLEADLDRVIKSGTEKKEVPAMEVVGKINTAYNAMGIARSAMVAEQVGLVLAEVEKTLDEGQKKAATGLIPKSLVSAKPEDATDEKRLRFWVGSVLLDPLATDLLQKMAR